jgi:hypothetical protein
MPVEISAEEIAEWKRRYEEGESISSIAAASCVSRKPRNATTIGQKLKQAGVEIRSHREARKLDVKTRRLNFGKYFESGHAKSK